MTGISISGKISTAVLRMTTGAKINTSNAITTKVYGRSRASLTIHIWPFVPYRGAALHGILAVNGKRFLSRRERLPPWKPPVLIHLFPEYKQLRSGPRAWFLFQSEL